MHKVTLLFGVLIATVCTAAAEAPSKAKDADQHALFGVPLGITYDEFTTLLREAGVHEFTVWRATEHDEFSIVWMGTLNAVPGKARTQAHFSNNRLFLVQVSLFDVSATVPENLKRTIEQKYGPGETKIGTNPRQNNWIFEKETAQIRFDCEWKYRELSISCFDRKLYEQVEQLRAATREKTRLAEEETRKKPGKNDTVDFGSNI